MDFDTIITNARIVTASSVYAHLCDIGIKSGKIIAIAISGTSTTQSGPSTSTTDTNTQRQPTPHVIDAEGAYVTPGGIDSHVHLHQDNAPSGDKWLSGSRSALAGGNTTIIAFATQEVSDKSLWPVIEEYHRRADNQSYIDYGFHLILTNPTPEILGELPDIVQQQGITSVKLYTTYPGKKLSDSQVLNIMLTTRSLGVTTMIHAENSDMIDLVTRKLLENQRTQPYYHAVARPQIVEDEATYRAISLAGLTDTPILIVHMSTPTALSHARKAQTKHFLPVHAETCPHYLYLTSTALAHGTGIIQSPDSGCDGHDHTDPWTGAKYICAPPLRHEDSDLQSVWDALNNGTITVVSSDHAPTCYNDVTGKKKPVALAEQKGDGSQPTFAATPNGLPGIETRLPLLFHAATDPNAPSSRKITLPKFVEATSTNAAKLYGLSDRKGVIAPGYDADITIWYPASDSRGRVKITNGMLHQDIDYTPFEGFEVGNWPRWTLLRGKVVWDRDMEVKNGVGKGLLGGPGDGEWLKRGNGEVLVGRKGQEPPGMRRGERAEWGLEA